MTEAERARDERILITARIGRDAPVAQAVLEQAGLTAEVCLDVTDLAARSADGVGALLLTEEVITSESADILLQMLGDQEPWSDVPIIVLTSGGEAEEASFRLIKLFGPVANVTLLERPMRPLTLVTAAQVALRARRRQYQVRDLLAQRERDLAKVQTAQQQAETANRAKDHFLATLSHELRLPLTPVLLTLSAMADDAETPGAIREQLEFMRRNVQLEARLIDDLLDLTRIARGKLSLEYEPVDVHAQLRHAVAICRGSNPMGAPIQLELRARRHRVWGDRARVQQVFWNVLANAIKFTPPSGGVEVRTWDGSGDQLQIEITDSGIGIEPEELGRIFGAFEQGNANVTRNFGGLGLGLAITRSLVELHHGSISASSPGRGHGTTFTVVLPVLDLPQIKSEPAAPIIVQRSLRILLVEDHDATLSALSRLLLKEGHQVETASRIHEAMEIAARHSFDMFICDLGLPDGSGVDFIRHLRAQQKTAPAIALSGLGMDEDVQASRAAGFDRHLVKPVDWQQLRSTIAEVIDGCLTRRGSAQMAEPASQQGEPSIA